MHRTTRITTYLGTLTIALAVSCGDTDEKPSDRTSSPLNASLNSDQCDTTQQCRDQYGDAATDCLNSRSDSSVCMCGSTRCDEGGGGGGDDKPVGQSGQWDLVFVDRFDGGTVDESIWDIETRSWGTWTWRRKNAFINNGDLVVRTQRDQHTRDGETKYFTSGIARSYRKFETGHYYEAKIQGSPHHPGFAPAFWLLNPDGTRRTVNGRTLNHWEIDIVELLQASRNVGKVDMNLHLRFTDRQWWRPSNKPGFGHHWNAPWDPRNAFHIYGVHVTNTAIIWYVDGVQRAIETDFEDYFQGDMNIILSQGLRPPYNDGRDPGGRLPSNFKTDMRVDWVKVFRRR